jgi:pilus assembly protein CpaB
MYVRAIVLLGLAAMSGTAAVYLARDWIESQVPQRVVVIEDRMATDKVVVARQDLARGDPLTRDRLAERDWPRDAVPEGAFASLDELVAQQRVTRRAIARHEPILAAKVTGEDGQVTLSAAIAEAMRAVTIRVNDVAGVAGFVHPGDHVDVLLTYQYNKRQPQTSILLQNRRVLGIDQDADEQDDKPKVARAVTLEVTPRQAQQLALAAQVGTLSLALRNAINAAPTAAAAVGLADLGPRDVPAADDRPPAVATAEAGAPGRRVDPAESTEALDRLARVTVTRGLASTQYRVTRALPSTVPASPIDTAALPLERRGIGAARCRV